MDCLYGFLSNISRDLVRGVVIQLRYPCCFNNFVEELKKEEDDLIATRESVQDRVAHGTKQTMQTAEVVHKWLKDADIGIEDVNNLLNKAMTKKSCCFGHCPNWILRYHFGRKLANKKKELQELIKKGEPFVQLELVATDKYLNFKSRESAYKQLMEAVKDEGVNMIGLYGMGGCGKTTLAEEIKRIAEAEHLFDKVLLVTVSSTVEVRGIQEKIASSMQYTFPVNEEKQRATALCERLTQEKKILVILDDVWQILDFGAIGIPLTEYHKGCKVLITTRSEDVCTLMDCQKKIQLQILTDEEAWTLFQKQAHISEDTSDTLKHLAREISDKCKGLPVAIASIASSLKGKDEEIWKFALNRLRNSKPMNIEKGLRDPYNYLQLSYDNLDTEEAKSLFLLCSVFPEDYKIPIEVLIKLAIGLGVVGEVRSCVEAKNEVIAAKIKLVSSCLLIMLDADDDDDDYDEYVKMHDLVRDVAHFIAKNENKVIRCQLENDVTMEQSSIRYLWCKEFPNDLDCSNLEFLCIATELEVLDGNFKRMGKLRVLFLTNEGEDDKRPLSTKSFKTLTNLRCLFLVGWELSNISFVKDTKKLQSLTLYRCSLPSFLDLQAEDAVKLLTNLKLLEFVECEMERNNYNVIGRIPLLEELRIIDGNQEWDDCNEDTIEFFKTFSVPPTLQSYVIKLGNLYCDEKLAFSHEGILLLSCFHLSNEAIKGLAKRAKVVGMGNIEGGAKNIIPDIFQMKEGGMNKLNELQISSSKEIEYLVDTSNHLSEVETLFSELLQLKIWEMDHLRVLWHGSLPLRGTFQKLEKLHLRNCPQLTSLFTQAIVSSPVRSTIFQNLQQVEVAGCEKLKYVFSANTVRGLPQLKQLLISHCNQLDHIIEDIIPSAPPVMDNARAQHEIIAEDTSIPSASLVSHSPGPFTLSNLTSLKLKSCPKLSSLFTVPTLKTLTSLEELSIQDCHGLKHIVTRERAHKNQKEDIVEEDHDLESVISTFSSLKRVYFSVISMFQSLKKVYINGCDLLQHIFCDFLLYEDNSCHLQQKIIQIGRQVSFVLEKLDLINLPQMTYILAASKNPFNLKYLKTLKIKRCPKLEVIFPLSVLRCLPSLASLQISECKELKQIMEQDLLEDQNLSNHLSPQPYFPKLTKLVVEKCHKLKRVFSTSASIGLSNLEILIINKAAQLEELIVCEHGKVHEIENANVEIPKLKLLIFMHLPNLCQGIEFQAVKHRIVHNCSELALTSTTTLQELGENIPYSDFENAKLSWRELLDLSDQINESDEVLTPGDTSELPLQINEESEKEFIGEVDGSEVEATITSTNLELNGMSSPNPLDISQRETNIEARGSRI